MQNYEALHDSTAINDDEAPPTLTIDSDNPRSRFSHIEDLDTFFQDTYYYHQGHGFRAIMLSTICNWIRKILVMFLIIFLIYGVDFACLKNHSPRHECIRSPTDIWQLMPWWLCTTVILSGFWFFCIMIRDIRKCFRMYDIREFYRNHLNIDDNDLSNYTWYTVKLRIREAQTKLKMVIQEVEISDLDISHRILRETNYFVALANKHQVPPRLNVIGLGEVVYWTPWLSTVLSCLLFGNWFMRKIGFSLFEKSFQLREQYKRQNLKLDNVQAFKSQVICFTIVTTLLIPLMFPWHLVQTFFKHAAMVRKCPSFLTKRRFSEYSRLFLRHFNELDHELEVRLHRAVKPANKYMGSFYNPIATILSNMGVFIASAVLGGMFIVCIMHPELDLFEYFLASITILYIVLETLGNLKPDEAISTDRAEALRKVMKHSHYLPDRWETEAHTERVRNEFQQLFQYRFTSILESLMQSVMVPYVLYAHVLPRCGELVDFFRCFTVSVTGVGDVCSFAQLDVRRHGNPLWHYETEGGNVAPTEQTQMAENGKLELSLAHFSLTNPDWPIPGAEDPAVSRYIASITSNNEQPNDQPANFTESHQSPERLVQNLEVNPNVHPQYRSHYSSRAFCDGLGGDHWTDRQHQQQNLTSWRLDERLSAGAPSPFNSTVYPFNTVGDEEYKLSGMWQVDGPGIGAAMQMSMNAEMIHNIHNMQNQRHNSTRSPQPAQQPIKETTPLLTSVTTPRH